MNKFKKIIQQAPTVSSKNLQRTGDTTGRQEELPFFDGRSLKRSTIQRSRQFNLRLRDELLQQLYKQASIEQKSLTNIVETALTEYFQKLLK